MALKDIPTAFRTDSEEEVRFAVARFFCDLGFTEQELSFEDHFKIRLGHNAVRIDGKDHKGKLTGRSDLLLARHGNNLAIVETKGPDHDLTDDDAEQAVSYARLLKQIAPYAIVTNGIQTKVYDVIQFAEISAPMECIWHQKGQQYSVVGQEERENAARHLFTFSPEIIRQKALLGLTGYLSALSKEPPINRAFIDRDLVGRDEAMDWLRNSPGDRLLVGQPGAGKTSLLYRLSKDDEQGAWFVRTKNDQEIAIAIREVSPKILLLDDAFNDREFIEQIMRLRNDPSIDGDFSLIATCWNGERKQIEPILTDQVGNAYELRRLKKDDMVKIVNGIGIKENIWLVQEIVDQAAGFPGLAVTLSDLAKREGEERIRTAEALANTILRFYDSVIEQPIRATLAALALGGNAGMNTDTVSKILDIKPVDLYESLRRLAMGGVISEVSNCPDQIKVRPDALRHALICDVFFSEPRLMPISIRDALIAETPSLKDTVLELIGAKRRGGRLPVGFLETHIQDLEAILWNEHQQMLSALPSKWKERLSASRSTWLEYERLHIIWEEYAWLGYCEAKWVIEHFTHKMSLIAPALLYLAPELAIPKLLDEAIHDRREMLHSHPDHPLRRLQDWVKGAFPERNETVRSSEAIRRRKAMLHGARRWLMAVGKNNAALGYEAMLYAMIPDFQRTVTDPGSGKTMTYYSGCLMEYELVALQQFWADTLKCTKDVEVPNWHVFLPTIWEWLHPSCRYSAEAYEVLHSFAKQMARDIAKAAADQIDVMHSLQQLMPELEIPIDDDVTTLYPIETPEADWRTQQDQWAQADFQLAGTWATREPAEVISRLESIEMKFSPAHRRRRRRTPYVCRRLAEKAPDPLVWFRIMLPTSLPSDTVKPFLQEAVRQKVDGWEQALRTCFATERLRDIAIEILLTQEHVSPDLQKAALRAASQYAYIVDHLVWSGRLPVEIEVKLYEHPDKELVGKLVVVEWQRGETGKVTDAIRPVWEQAFVRYCEDDYWIGEILKAEPALGLKWFGHRLAGDSFRFPYLLKTEIDKILANWCLEDRHKLLKLVPNDYFDNDLIAGIVGENPESYKLLLQQRDRGKSALLAPLYRPLDSVWETFAKQAHGHDYDPDEIAQHTITRFGGIMSYEGRESDMWKKRCDQFAELKDHDVDFIRRVGKSGYLKSLKNYEYYKKQEDDEDVHGRDWN